MVIDIPASREAAPMTVIGRWTQWINSAARMSAPPIISGARPRPEAFFCVRPAAFDRHTFAENLQRAETYV